MRPYLLLLLLLLARPVCAQQQDSLMQRIVLIGDGGALTADGHHTVVEAVEKLVPLDKRTTVLFLGDNLYRHGLPDDQYRFYQAARAVLDSQANIADHAQGMVYFIPGNHDWMNGAAGGYAAILREQTYLDGLGKKNLKFLPESGCPGPEVVDMGNDVLLVIMDSQWWIHQNDKPGIESDCRYKTEEEVVGELQDIVSQNQKKLIIFACHHPFRTNGAHGGYYTLKQHIFPFTDMRKNLYIPLPGLGSIYPISRSVFGTPQDLKHPNYANMAAKVDEVLNAHPHVIRVAGHEHAMEWIADSNAHYIVSGSGCKTARVSTSRQSKFEASHLGFATLDIYKDRLVRCTFYGASGDSLHALYSDTIFNYGHLPKPDNDDVAVPLHSFGDTVYVAASTKYGIEVHGIKKLFNGQNYRRVWSQPVSLPVFRLHQTNGGFRITGSGGGFQTKSIHLEDKDGVAYNLRTIDKDPRKVLPPGARSSFARDVVQDMISAAHPYAPLTVSAMADAAGILHSRPVFYYVPDDTAFGFYRPLFNAKVCMLEPKNGSMNELKTRSTTKLINKLIGDNDHFVVQDEVLQARLLDMTIGDWDRHFDQWRWAVDDTGKGKLYHPIPRDRDQAFFNSDGALVWLASRRYLRWMRGFHYEYKKFRWLSHSARDFDRIFMNELDEQRWRSGIDRFCRAESDAVIDDAVRRMPPEIQSISGPVIAGKLKSRRDRLPEAAMHYYRFLSREVSVLGSNKNEYFTVRQVDSGLLVQVHAKTKDNDTAQLMYSRVFDPKVTKEIRMYGFNGNDVFAVDTNVHGRTILRMIGGRGNDTFNVQGRLRSHVYDLSTEDNPVIAANHTDVNKSASPAINEYKTVSFQYDYTQFPTINLGYNPEDGLLLGAGINRRTFGFRKDPFKSDQRVSFLYSPFWNAFQARYRGVLNGARGGFDLVLNGDLEMPALRNFYGFGNNTEVAPGKDFKFYRVRYKYAAADVLAQRRLFGKGVLRLQAGPSVFHYWNSQNRNGDLVLERPQLVGLDSADVFRTKTYIGGKLVADVNNVNNELFPTRGISWRTTFTALGNVNNNARPYTDLHTDMNVYASLSDPAKLIAVLRAGGGHIFSDHFEYFQAESIGASNFLRGVRKNRYSGRSMAYGSAELRIKLLDVRSYALPGTLGAVAFDDLARVWMDNEESRRWHNAFGGGLYYIPFDLFIVSGTVAFSPEQRALFNITLGTRFGLTF